MQLFVSVPGAAEKPYMVEEAVSYNELDYISVSAVWGGSRGQVGGYPRLFACRDGSSSTVECFCGALCP